MLPSSLLAYDIREGLILPHYLTPRDEPWIRLLIDELDALVGRTQGDAACILADKTLEISATYGVPIAAVRAVRHLLERLWRARPAAGIPSREIRRVVFELGADPATPRDEVLRRAADVLRLRPEQVSEGLFADSSSERRLSAPQEEPSPRDLIDEHNIGLVQEFLLRSERVILNVGAQAAPVIAVAKQKGVMYAFTPGPRGAVIALPGPISLFQQTVRYGRALAALFPVVAAVPDWSLEAKCLMGAKMARFHACAADPISAPPQKDVVNPVERRLLSDFRRLGSRWSIVRPSPPLQASGSTFFPDFTLEHGMDRVHVEIIGFHTAAYLETKRQALRSAGNSSVVLCVDEALTCSERIAPTEDPVFHFQGRIEVGRLLGTIERLCAGPSRGPASNRPNG